MKYTAPVRRGFAIMLNHKLAELSEKVIEHWQRPGLSRAERMTAAEAADLRAAVAWLQQEALHPDQDEADAAANQAERQQEAFEQEQGAESSDPSAGPATITGVSP